MVRTMFFSFICKKEVNDPVLNFQISNDFRPTRIIKNYLEGDVDSKDYAVLLEWDNIYYEKHVVRTLKNFINS